jgi:hypothetical protein
MFNLKFYTMKVVLEIIKAGWVLALSLATIHIYIDLIPLKLWYLQVFVLLAAATLITAWFVMVAKILNSIKVGTKKTTEGLNIPFVSAYVCPECGSRKVLDWVSEKGLYCSNCEHEWANER